MDGGAKPNRRQAQKLATRAHLLAVAAAAFARDGYEPVTFRALAVLAGGSTGKWFAHWSDKRTLYREATGRLPPEDFAAMAPTVADFLERVAIKCAGVAGVEPLSEEAMRLRLALMNPDAVGA